MTDTLTAPFHTAQRLELAGIVGKHLG